MTGIYKITSPSGRIYIGQTLDFEKRFRYYHALACKTQPKIHRSLLKYGYAAHKFEVIEVCDISLLNDRERYFQEKFNCISDGLNCDLVNSSNAPRKRSKETVAKISAGLRKRVWKESSKKKLSATRTGMKFTKEHCDNMSVSKKGLLNARSKLVMNTQTGIFYHSVTQAAEAHGINNKTLSKYLLGSRKNKTSLIFA